METEIKYHTEYRVYEMLREGSDYMWVVDILYVHLGWAWRYKREDRIGGVEREVKGEGERCRRVRLLSTTVCC